MQFIDLQAQQERIRDKIDAGIQKILSHGQYIMGPEIRELEKRLAAYVGVKHAVGCSSGTDALLLGLMALGIGPGDAVFTTPFTFIATAEVVSLLGAVPVFVDIDPKTYNIDPGSLSRAIEAVKTDDPSKHPLPARRGRLAPRAVIPVDLFGLLADYDRLQAIAAENRLFVIEDAAQSFGATLKGRKACSFGDIACTSFFPAKPLGCYGDGGMCFTDDDRLASIMDSLRVHGKGEDKYDNIRIGINGRIDTIQAAVLLAKFEIFPDELEKREAVARRYTELFSGIPGIATPHVPEEMRSAWAQYSLLARDGNERDGLMGKLKKAGIPTAIYYPKPLHLQTAFSNLGYPPGAFPVSEDCARRIFSVPMHPYLKLEDQKRIAEEAGKAGHG
jgi:UDP-2-acetamido-2-deoxy-ribo-hexuluronate aminotransferase